MFKNLLQATHALGVERDKAETKRLIYDDVVDLLQLLIESKRGLKSLVSLALEQKESSPMVYKVRHERRFA